MLVEEVRGVKEARQKFDSLFGSLAGVKNVRVELELARKKEKEILEKKALAS